MEDINNDIQLRMTLLKETGYNVEKAQKCWDFVRGGYEAGKANNRCTDGVYFIDKVMQYVMAGNISKL